MLEYFFYLLSLKSVAFVFNKIFLFCIFRETAIRKCAVKENPDSKSNGDCISGERCAWFNNVYIFVSNVNDCGWIPEIIINNHYFYIMHNLKLNWTIHRRICMKKDGKTNRLFWRRWDWKWFFTKELKFICKVYTCMVYMQFWYVHTTFLLWFQNHSKIVRITIICVMWIILLLTEETEKRRITSTCEEAADGTDSDCSKCSTSSIRYVPLFMDDNCNLVIC